MTVGFVRTMLEFILDRPGVRRPALRARAPQSAAKPLCAAPLHRAWQSWCRPLLYKKLRIPQGMVGVSLRKTPYRHPVYSCSGTPIVL